MEHCAVCGVLTPEDMPICDDCWHQSDDGDYEDEDWEDEYDD